MLATALPSKLCAGVDLLSPDASPPPPSRRNASLVHTALYQRLLTTLARPLTALIVAVTASLASGPNKWERSEWATQLC